MNQLEVRRFEMLKRVRDFGSQQKQFFPDGGLGNQTLMHIQEALSQYAEQGAEQTSGGGSARGSVSTKAELRVSIREELEAMRRTARIIAQDIKNLDDRFRIPRQPNDEVLLATARSFVKDAYPLQADFIRHEMPDNFLSELKEMIDDFEKAISEKNQGKGSQVIATAAIDAALERGMEAVRKLNVIVRNKFRHDPLILAAWTSASHTERADRSAKSKTPSKPEPEPKE